MPLFNRRKTAFSLTVLALSGLTGCALYDPTRLAEPVLQRAASPEQFWLNAANRIDARLDRLLNVPSWPHIMLLGEQHDAPEHHLIEREVVASLTRQGRLHALALEMADAGRSTADLPPDSSEALVRVALDWNDNAWAWANYGPTIMLAVAESVPVFGANLPRSEHRNAIKNEALDVSVPAHTKEKLDHLMVQGHCGLLKAPNIRPMTRIQIARDQSMAQSLARAISTGAPAASTEQAVKPVSQMRHSKPVVLLIAGQQHANRALGVPLHLPVWAVAKVVTLQSAPEGKTPSEVSAIPDLAVTDALWVTEAVAAKDYCAALTGTPAFAEHAAKPIQ
jgi:uncharacterized iron-regulated protein